jgi:Uma2 family endonuclease
MSTVVGTLPRAKLKPRTKPQKDVTPEDLLAMPDGGRFELVDGKLRELKVSLLSTVIAALITRILGNHCHAHSSGWIPSAELGYQCFSWKPGQVRRADVSFIRAERVTAERWHEGFCPIPPDLAVEVVSPNDQVDELDEKINEYLRAGVKLIWVVHPVLRAVQVFRSDGTVGWLRLDDELSGEDVIPGFQCRVSELFPKGVEAAKPKPRSSPPRKGKPRSNRPGS